MFVTVDDRVLHSDYPCDRIWRCVWLSYIYLPHLTQTISDGQEPGVLVPGVPVPTKYSRNYESVPQPGLNGRTSPVYTAAVVGGGTVINGMFFQRGSVGDYDAWAKIGNPGWGWNDLLPYFKKVGPMASVYLSCC